MPSITIREIILISSQKLKEVSDSARIDVERLLCKILDVSTSYLYTWSEQTLTSYELQQFKALFKKRLNGEPVAYLIGEQGFWNLQLIVNKHTLIPRADTEVLIEVILKKFQQHVKLDLLDLGTGSGAIGLSLAHERPEWQITAIDYCEKALIVATQNKNRYQLKNVQLLCGNWYTPIGNKQFDIIVSNPPYIDQHDSALCKHVRKYEPLTALIANDNGLANIKQIICDGKTHLKPNGFMIIEHGFQQAQSVTNIFRSYNYGNIQHYQDLNGYIRTTSVN